MPEVVIDPRVWNELYADLRKFEPSLAVGLRRALKEIGGRAAKAVQDELNDGRGQIGADDIEGIKSGVSAKVSFTAKSAGVKIVASASKLPTSDKGLLKAFNLQKFRHPVFGRGTRSVWVEQGGHPYFGAAITKVVDDDLLDEISEAVNFATRAIGAHGE